LQALAPQFHLRADRFYNAPDTEIDFTEQGGLMWGEYAVGKLVAGADALTPGIEVFVDEAAGPEVAQKVERRLQHFVTRKIAALFEPLQNLQNDEALTGLARGFAFRMVEALGILPRAQVAQEVKDLDQDARGALRKHGIRFGQFTIFMPLLLKPAPTRLRLVLWSLANGLDMFPEAPPPGLVTVPTIADAPEGYDTMCGYRAAGERSIRIDMLERLADMLRGEDSRGGFEAKPDMLSITGMTLEQFADLMQGLGYRAEKGERVKVKKPQADAPAAAAPAAEAGATEEAAAEGTEAAAEQVDAPVAADAAGEAVEAAEATPAVAEGDVAADAAEADAEPEMEVFFTFTWGRTRQGGGNRRGQGQGRGQAQGGERNQGKPRNAGKPRAGGKPQGKKGGKPQNQGGKTFSARPPKKEKAIDPDNPFAALLALKEGN
jgi:ATP-dependent RNA helicase SUPV3L1/SUV3